MKMTMREVDGDDQDVNGVEARQRLAGTLRSRKDESEL